MTTPTNDVCVWRKGSIVNRMGGWQFWQTACFYKCSLMAEVEEYTFCPNCSKPLVIDEEKDCG